jgi:hypothetical protein
MLKEDLQESNTEHEANVELLPPVQVELSYLL